MKKVSFTFAIIVITIITTLINAQQGWFQQNGANSLLYSVFFRNANYGFTVNLYGKVFKTINGGTNWVLKNTPTTNSLHSIYFLNDSLGFIVGGLGTILKTTNGGENWSLIPSGTLYELWQVTFVDTVSGYIIGEIDKLYKTTNAGTNWILQPTGTGRSFECINFINNNTGWLIGGWYIDTTFYSTIYKTTNFGTNWVPQDSIPFLTSVYFTSPTIGYVTGHSGKIYKTTNSGSNWLPQISNTTKDLYRSFFLSSLTGYCPGRDGVILYTSNGGVNWFNQTSNTNNLLFATYFLNINTGWVVGDNGTILKTTNGGITFIQKQPTEIPKSFSLSQNYPNPFNPSTYIRFDVPHKSVINLFIYDVAGRLIKTVVNEVLTAGSYQVDFDGSNLSSGFYYYRFFTDQYSQTKKMVLLK